MALVTLKRTCCPHGSRNLSGGVRESRLNLLTLRSHRAKETIGSKRLLLANGLTYALLYASCPLATGTDRSYLYDVRLRASVRVDHALTLSHGSR